MESGHGQRYPLTLICAVYRLARLSIYAAAPTSPTESAGKRGPKTADRVLRLMRIHELLARRRLGPPKSTVKAPESIVKAVEAAVSLPFADGIKCERELFAELINSPESKAQRYFFLAEAERVGTRVCWRGVHDPPGRMV